MTYLSISRSPSLLFDAVENEEAGKLDDNRPCPLPVLQQ